MVFWALCRYGDVYWVWIGDLTFNIGYLSSSSVDEAYGTAGTGVKDEKSHTSASVDYVIASGVTGTLGYRDQEGTDEGTVQTEASGSSWYIGANISF